MRDDNLIEAIERELDVNEAVMADPMRLRRMKAERIARAALAAAEAAGYRMVREARECRHCGWLCAPNSEQSKSWYPLEQAPAVQESGDA